MVGSPPRALDGDRSATISGSSRPRPETIAASWTVYMTVGHVVIRLHIAVGAKEDVFRAGRALRV
jgi:hypothetical protein